MYSHISAVWTTERFQIIFGLFDELENSDQSSELIVNSIGSYLDWIDVKISSQTADL
jgi:hypothetical protein